MLKTGMSSDDPVVVSMRVKQVQEKLCDCRSMIDDALHEIEERFPKSIFDSVDPVVEDYTSEKYQGEEEMASQSALPNEDMNSEAFDAASSVPELSPPMSPTKEKGETESNYVSDLSQRPPMSPGASSMAASTRPHSDMRRSMFKIFKISTGNHSHDAKLTGSDVIPLVTSVPREPVHSLLHLFRLEVPKSLGVVSRLAVSEDGYVAGCTVHGEIFVYWKLPYSRHPDSITRGHDGGIASLEWLQGSELRGCFVTNGTDRKTLLWQITENGIDGPLVELRHAGEGAIPTCCSIHPVNRDIVIIGFLDHSFGMFKVVVDLVDLPKIVSLGISASFAKPITSLAVSPDGRRLAVGSSSGTVGLFDLNTLSMDVEVDCRNRTGSTSHGRKVTGLDWSEDSTCLCVSSCDSRIRVILVSDLSRRTKFKSPFFRSENLFLHAKFDNERVLAVSESGNFCAWKLHAGNDTNEKCLRCDLSNPPGPGAPEITASLFVPAGSAWGMAVQGKFSDLGDGFQKEAGLFVLTCDTGGTIRILAELWAKG